MLSYVITLKAQFTWAIYCTQKGREKERVIGLYTSSFFFSFSFVLVHRTFTMHLEVVCPMWTNVKSGFYLELNIISKLENFPLEKSDFTSPSSTMLSYYQQYEERNILHQNSFFHSSNEEKKECFISSSVFKSSINKIISRKINSLNDIDDDETSAFYSSVHASVKKRRTSSSPHHHHQASFEDSSMILTSKSGVRLHHHHHHHRCKIEILV